MSKNCIKCLVNERTGTDLLCDVCRLAEPEPDIALPDELRSIAKEMVRTMVWGLEASQYCGLRLRLIANEMERLQQSVEADAEICSVCGKEVDFIVCQQCSDATIANLR